jgi:hypothetical protein
LRRLWLARVVFAGFSLTWVLVYRRLEGLGWQDALFWMIPAARDRWAAGAPCDQAVFAVCLCGVRAFQIGVAEQVAVAIFDRQGAS